MNVLSIRYRLVLDLKLVLQRVYSQTTLGRGQQRLSLRRNHRYYAGEVAYSLLIRNRIGNKISIVYFLIIPPG
jgi:hypothetical protein